MNERKYLLSWADLTKLVLVTGTPTDKEQCPKSILISDNVNKPIELHNNQVMGGHYIIPFNKLRNRLTSITV